MGAGITLQGLAINNPTPGIFLEIDFAVGQPAGIGVTRPILLMGNKTSAGVAVVDTVVYGPNTDVPLLTEADAVYLFGAGSELHRQFRRLPAIQQAVSVYAIAVTASAGASASIPFVFTFTSGTTANVTSNVRVWIDDEFVDATIVQGASLADITLALSTAINARLHWPGTAAQTQTTVANDTVVVTAKIPGPRGNLHRGKALISAGGGTASNVAVTNTADSAWSGGTTADSNTVALATVANRRFYYIASAANDATQFGALSSQVTTQALPMNARRQRCFAGSSDTLSNTTTLATGVNNPRAEVAWLQASPVHPSEIAAVVSAVYAQGENSGSKPRCNWNGYGSNGEPWGIIAPRLESALPSSASITAALQNGITPIGVDSTTKQTSIVKRVTTKSLNGSTNDYRIRDAHKVTICDFFGDDLVAKFGAQFSGKNLMDDPKPGSPPPGDDTTTPARIRDAVFGLVDDYGEAPIGNNLLVNTDQIKAGIIVQREKPQNMTRVSILLPLQTIDILDQLATLEQQVA